MEIPAGAVIARYRGVCWRGDRKFVVLEPLNVATKQKEAQGIHAQSQAGSQGRKAAKGDHIRS